MKKSALALVVLLSMTLVSADNESAEWHTGFAEGDASASGVIVALMKRLPSIWAMRIKAGRLANKLPDLPLEVETPDSQLIYSWIEGICRTPHRRPGTPEGHKAEKWVAAKFREMGLENVSMDPVEITVWTADYWSLEVEGEEVPSFYVVNTGFTGPEGVTAPMVYVGEGSPREFEKEDVSGKIVVADVPFPYLPSGLLLKGLKVSYYVSDPDHSITMRSGQYLNFVRENFLGNAEEEHAPPSDVYWQAKKRGAAALCLILRDQPAGTNTHYGPYDGIMKPMPALWIGKREGESLRQAAREGRQATLTLTGRKEPGTMHNVWGVLPGRSDQVILVTSHHDAPFKGASEDGAGTAQVLAQAWAWSRVPKQDRPKTMVFVVDAGHFYGSLGGHAFARQHEDIMERTRILITLEHLGAKEVVEDGTRYKETGNLALTVMFTSHDPVVAAAAIKSLREQPAKSTVSIPADFFGPAPTSDASGYVLEAGVPVISWIGCPYYLLDAHDTLDKIEVSELEPIAKTVTQMVKSFMAMD